MVVLVAAAALFVHCFPYYKKNQSYSPAAALAPAIATRGLLLQCSSVLPSYAHSASVEEKKPKKMKWH